MEWLSSLIMSSEVIKSFSEASCSPFALSREIPDLRVFGW